MLSPIAQNVRERISDLRRRSQRRCEISIGKDLTTSAEPRVDALGERDLKATHTARQRLGVVGFDQQMQMGTLHRDMANSKIGATQLRREGAADRVPSASAAETRKL